MKHVLLLMSLFLTIVSCKDKEYGCHSSTFAPNYYKYYLPYQIGEQIFLTDSLGNQDTITILDINSSKITYSSKDCFQPSETWTVDFILATYGGEHYTFRYSSGAAKYPPYLIVSVEECKLNASFFQLGPNSGTIEVTHQYTFDQTVYSAALLIHMDEPSCPLESVALARDIGFIYILLDGKIRTVI